jgi:serine/threonine-protein kinase
MSRTPIGRGGAPLPFEGRMFGGYRIADAIATGGMASVYLARKTGPGRYAQTAAIKIIHPHLAKNRELAEMFMDEARLASCVNHPSVCRVLDFGEAEGTYFLAMEYVRGESWATVLPALIASPSCNARVVALALHVLSSACEGLHAIHDAIGPDGRSLNIVHRDVSPQNLLIAYDGSVRLLDFGIASAEGRAHTGSTEVVRGRYAYMAPEQMRGLDVDRRADLWSLGVMLFEALTGQNPFIRDTQIATMLAVTQEPLPSWPLAGHDELERIAQLTLARTPEERFSSARELGDSLTRLLGRSGESALGAELSRAMRQLFAAQIAEKRAALRELSGEDGVTETFPSGYPPVKASATPPELTELTELTGAKPARAAQTRRPARSVLAAGMGLFVLTSAASWYLVHQEAAPAADPAGDDVALAPHEPVSPPALVEEVPAERAPTEGQATAASGAALGAAAPAPGHAEPGEPAGAEPPRGVSPEPPAEAADDSEREDSRPRRHHRRRDEAQDDSAAAGSGEARASAREDKPSETEHPSKATGPGTIVVGTTQGWALVFEGARKLGTTPLKLDLPSGAHTLIVRPYGEGSPRRVPVEIKPGEVTKLRVEI